MTKIARKRKIENWESVKEKIREILENVPDHTNALSLPYGLQSLYTISHHEPVRILLHPSLNDYDTFVTHHGKAKKFYLNLWTVNQKGCSEKEKIKQQRIRVNYQIKHIVFVPTHRCFVAFATDLSLRVFATINFNEMSRVQTSHSVLCLFYNACRDDVLAGCLGFVMIWKFPQAQNGCLVPMQKIDCSSISSEYWVIWIKVDKCSKQLLVNCEEAIVILDERTYKLRYNFKIDFRHYLPFSACAFYHPSCYFITGSKDYAVKVWNTSLKQCPLVTTFNGHCNAITALEVDVPHHLVISSSSDKTIRLWCLETFAQTYCLETGEEVHRMELMTSRRLFYQSHEHIRVCNLNHFHTLFTVLGFEIVTSRRVESPGCPTRLLLHGKDGAIRIVSPTDGTIITTMFPLETIPENIVDYAYNPREDRLYVVLSSGAILVFSTRTNPCCTYELWKSQHCDEKVVSVAMMNIDEVSETEDNLVRYSLLFVGLDNGQISLAYSNELTMTDTIEAHYGQVVLLCVSQIPEQHEDESFTAESNLLVSSGIDCLLKIWKVVRNSSKVITLEMWSLVKLLSVPQDMDLIGSTIGLIMDNNSLMTCRFNSELDRHKNKAAQRDSISRYDQYNVECFTSLPEEKHSKAISGLSACPTLGLFATSSYDWSVKIWNTTAKLVKEICFDESLRGVCFANPRGDLLVGFQSHISIVPLTNYLPLNFLEMLATMQFPDDVFEDNLPFDRMLSFSYDPLRTPCLPLDLQLRRAIEKEQESLCIKPILRITSTIFSTDNQGEEAVTRNEAIEPPRRYSITQEQEELDEKIRKLQPSALSRRSSAVQSPLLEEVIARITQSFSSRSELNASKTQSYSTNELAEQLRKLFEGDDDDKIPDDYWPCAPDGFIPNSVVRKLVPPMKIPAHLIPKIMRGDELKEWLKNTKRKESTDAIDNLPEDSFSSVVIDDDLEFYSIFDGFKDPKLSDQKPQFEEDEEDEEEDSDEERDLRKKWKASTKTAMNKNTMLSTLRSRQAMKERKKVSKKPDMPMIVAEEEEEENLNLDKPHEPQEAEKCEKEEEAEEEKPDFEVPQILLSVLQQPWFPKSSITAGVTVESIFGEMINVMSSCAPLTYNKICNEILAIQTSIGISDSLKEKTLHIMVDNLGHPSATIRRASLKTVKELNCKSAQAITGIVSCLNHKSLELQHDAMNALEHLLGIKTKKDLKDLFVSLDILSRSPSPVAVPSCLQIKRLFEKKKLLASNADWRIDKESFIQDWLTINLDEEEKEDNKLNVSREVGLAASIISKLKLYKKEPRLSIIDLTFNDSSSSPVSSVEEGFQTANQTKDLFEELKKTKAGWKLLSRMGYTRMYNPEDSPRTHEEQRKPENPPPSFLKGRTCGKMNKEVADTQDLSPEIHVSEASTITKKSDEAAPALDKLVLPKIFNRIKLFQQNMTDFNPHGKKRRCKGRDVLTVPEFSSSDDDMLRRGKTKMHNYPNLPEIRHSRSRSQLTSDPEALDQTDHKPKAPLKPGKRLKLCEDTSSIDPEQRKSILKGLQDRRMGGKQVIPASQLSETRKKHSSLLSSPSVNGSNESEFISPPIVTSATQPTPDVRLPKINVRSKMVDPKEIMSNRTLITSDNVRSMVGTVVQPMQYAYPYDYTSGVIGERLSRSLSVRPKKDCSKVDLENELWRVLPVDSKLTVDTGQHKWGRSRYGILEVLWTALNYENNEGLEGSLIEDLNNTKQLTEDKLQRKKSKHLKNTPMAVKRLLKPIRNRNLVSNPYTNTKPSYDVANNEKRSSKMTNYPECVQSTSTNSGSVSAESLTNSKQELKTDELCTIRELLNVRS